MLDLYIKIFNVLLNTPNVQLVASLSVFCKFRFFKRFTMDTIWNVAYGIDSEIQEDKQNDYFDQSEQLFKVASAPKHPILLFASNLTEI
jgi:hypothetical protein